MFPLDSKILIVDDSRVTRLFSRRALAEAKYTKIFEAQDGQQALDLIEKSLEENEPINLLLLDVNMPVLSGVELVKKLKSSPALSRIPIIMITSEGEKQFIADVFKLGVNDYLVKPMTGEALLEKMNHVAQTLSL